jgi:hypothetical protein
MSTIPELGTARIHELVGAFRDRSCYYMIENMS